MLSRFLVNPNKEHLNVVKWVVRYLKGTSRFCLCFGGDKLILEGYTDFDMARDINTRKSFSGYLCTFARGAVS